METHIDTPSDTASDISHWQSLPLRARTLFALTHAMGFGIAAAILSVAGATLLSAFIDHALVFPVVIVLGLAAGVAFGAWLGVKQYRHTYWLIDRDGFALRRGRLWQRESRVPASRVQHLDIKHGPMERRYGLATLVIHTAGTRLNTVSVGGLDAGDAEHLRDDLAQRIEADVDA